jgi:hypothetical protein
MTFTEQADYRDLLDLRIKQSIAEYENVTGWSVISLMYAPGVSEVVTEITPRVELGEGVAIR